MLATNSEVQRSASGCRRLSDIPNWIHAFAWGGVGGLVLLLVGLAHFYDGHNVWNGWVESHELRQPGYAERIYPDDLLRTRANAWSNLAYVLIGFYALGLGFLDLRRKSSLAAGYLTGTPPMSFLFGVMCCYLGFGSGFFHASLTRAGQQLDVAAMYAPLLAIIAINLGGWIPRLKIRRDDAGIPSWPILTGLVLVASFLLYEYKWSMSSAKVLPTLILTVSVLAVLDQFQRRRRHGVRWLVLSLVALISARICWQVDVAKKFSGPDAWLQGHAIWHLLTALSLASIYFFYRLEAGSNPPAQRQRFSPV